MNQAIQFSDREEWNASMQAVCFPALVNGMQVICAIKGDMLAQRYGGETAEQYLALFRDYRWDLEEEAEQLIRQQAEDAQGVVWLS